MREEDAQKEESLEREERFNNSVESFRKEKKKQSKSAFAYLPYVLTILSIGYALYRYQKIFKNKSN